MKNIIFLLIISSVIFLAGYVDAGNFGIGVHSGYGVLKYEEQTSAFESESTQNIILFGVSGEYSFPPRRKIFYAGITTDWALGLKDSETWRENNVEVQTNDMSVFGQFYDLRFGYKNSFNNLYYRFYMSGGWDGLHFKRDNFWGNSVTEDISLWRTGTGIALGFKQDKWALNGRVAYSYYPEGKTEYSSLPESTFDTNGTCLDIGVGISREIAKNTSFYLGGNYTLQKLEGSTKGQAISWESKLEILVGVFNLTFAF